MKSHSALLALALALVVTAAVTQQQAVAVDAATTNSTTAALCADTTRVTLGSCGSGKCGEDQPCAQYPSGSTVVCSDAAGAKCVEQDATCTYQCLDNAYAPAAMKWTLFVKDPKSVDVYASAPIEKISTGVFSSDMHNIQITGFDSASVQKGSTKTVAIDSTAFAQANILEMLIVTNVDLSSVQAGLLPKSVTALYLQNCNLKAFPDDIASMSNLIDLNLAKNAITETPASSSSVGTAIQQVRTLDLSANSLKKFDLVLPEVYMLNLGDNALETFPSVIFNMTKLTSINLKGNSISSLVVTKTQFTTLKRLLTNSTLGVTAVTGSCGSGATEDKVLDAVVCISDTASGSGTSGTSTDEKKSGGGSSSTIIIVVCVAAAVLVLGGVGFYCYRKKSGPGKDDHFATMSYNNNNTNQSGRTGSSMGQQRPSGYNFTRQGPSFSTNGTTGDYSQIGRLQSEMGTMNASTQESQHARETPKISKSVVRIDAREMNYTRSIAKGAFGQVWLAHYNGSLVAVKKMLTNDPANVADFVAELNLLAHLNHPRILGLVGACYDDALSDLQIVMEFMDSGDLLTVLRKHSPAELTWDNGKGTFCVQICEAVYYLHSLATPLIHRDIKSRNILMDSHKGAKLSDFGESRERTFQQTMTAGVGTARWVAPEIILGEDYSELADIYSLGVLLTELDTHKIPYQDMGLEETTIVQQVAVGKLKPKVSDTCPEVIRRLTHECLQSDPQLRPSAARVLQTLMSSTLARRATTILESE
ncbi:Tkl protein kinase [Globisporangium polare]